MKHCYWLIFCFLPLSVFSQSYNMGNTSDTTCGGIFYDNGGASGYYSNNVRITHTFYSSNGERLAFAFTAFRLYSTSDYLAVYDGPDRSYPLLDVYSTNNIPDSITSSDSTMTFYFYSNWSRNQSGWAANISCAGSVLKRYPITHNAADTLCKGLFLDDGGQTGNYSSSLNREHTLCADDTSKHLQLDFAPRGCDISFNDTLWVYDGPSSNNKVLAAFTDNANYEQITSTHDCLTMRFESDNSGTNDGWQANISCTTTPGTGSQTYIMSSGVRSVCSGTFYDAGGTSNYPDNERRTQTFRSKDGKRIAVNFKSFRTANVYDYLDIYDGPDRSFPRIGRFSYTDDPDSIISSRDALTFYFYSSGGLNHAGWEADFSCGGPVLPTINHAHQQQDSTCNAVFYDMGGPTRNYSSSSGPLHTICSDDTSKQISFDFNLNATTFSTGDTLWAYDGTTENAPPLGVYVAGSRIEKLTSTSGCITYRFRSDASREAQGYQAYITCDQGPTAQEYIMSSGTRYICNGTFYDAGYKSNYPDNERRTQTFKSFSGNRIAVNFSSFRTANSFDYLMVYDGPSRDYPLLGRYAYRDDPDSIISSGDALTFYFYSSSGLNDAGWEAEFSCGGPVLPIINHRHQQTDSTCNAVFYDIGGSNENYSSNAGPLHTICSDDTTKEISFTFNHLATRFSTGDTLWAYDGTSENDPPLGIYAAGSRIEKLTSTSGCITYRFRSDGSREEQGFQALVDCETQTPAPQEYIMSSGTRFICNGTFYDAGYKSNYPDNESRTQTFRSFSGNRIAVNFTSFRTANIFDYLMVYDGPSRDYPLLGRYAYRDDPDSIISSGDALTFYFYSSRGLNDAGWEAEFSCGGPVLPVINHTHQQTDSTCNAVFYDIGGSHENYSSNAGPLHTICSDDTTKEISLTFNHLATRFSTGDTLWAFDGTTENDPPLGIYAAGSRIEKLTSTSGCITYRFRSDASREEQGYQAWIDCETATPAPQDYIMSSGTRYVCSGTFYDAGYKGNYPDNERRTQTFRSYSGGRLAVNFTSFRTAHVFDYLLIYDGPSTEYPLIGRYDYTDDPDSIMSTGDALTFYFYSSGSSTHAGWEAELSCGGPVLQQIVLANNQMDSTCSGVFYDNGGPNGAYPNNSNATHTICSDDSTKQVRITFNPNAISLHPSDTLIAYNGNSASGEMMAKFTSGSNMETLQSSNGCLTFQLQSDQSNNGNGWQGYIGCDTQLVENEYRMSSGVRYVCSGTFTDQGGARGNYADNSRLTQTFVSKNGDHIRMVFKAFRTANRFDYLRVYDGYSTSAKLIGTYSYTSGPDTLISSGKALTFYFYSNWSGTQAGWDADIDCITRPPKPTLQYKRPLCEGDTLRLSAQTLQGVRYFWEGPNGFSSSSSSPTIPNVDSTHAGTYSLYVRNWGFTSDTGYINVRVGNKPAAPVISAQGQTTFCAGGSVTLNSSYSAKNLWNTQDTSSSLVITQSGKYSVRYTTPFGCVSDSSSAVNVTVNPLPKKPTINRTGTLSFCQGDSVVLQSSFNRGNRWSNNDTNRSITVKTAGNYHVQVTDQNGCSVHSDTLSVNVYTRPSQPSISITRDTTFCKGDSVILTSSNAIYNRWSTGDTSRGIVVKQSAQVSLAVTDRNGCKSVSTRTINISANANPSAPRLQASGATRFCKGDSVVLSTNYSSGIKWSNNDTSAKLVVKSSGRYFATYTNQNGCSASSSDTSITVLSAPSKPSISITRDTTFCQGDSVILTSNSGRWNRWSTGDSTRSIVLKNSAQVRLRLQHPNGCASPLTRTYSITANTNPSTPTLSILGNTSFCSGDSAVLSSNYSSSLRWNTGATTSTLVVKQSGKYSVTYTDGNGCDASSKDTTITVKTTPRKPSISITRDTTFCQGDSVMLQSNYNIGNQWSNGDTTKQITVQRSAVISLRHQATNGCVSPRSRTVTITRNPVPAKPSVTINGNTRFCAGDSVELISFYNVGNQWNNGDTTQGIWVRSSGSYRVINTNQFGCISDTSNAVQVQVDPVPNQPSISYTGNTSFCEGDSLVLRSNYNTGNEWSNGDTNQVLVVKLSGQYVVQNTNRFGCTSPLSNSINVQVLPVPSKPTITAAGNTTFCFGDSVRLISSATSQNEWSNGSTSREIFARLGGNYTVRAKGTNGCLSPASDTVPVIVNPLPSAPTVQANGPTAFCEGDSVQLDVLNNESIRWNDGNQDKQRSIRVAGSYSARALSNEGCFSPVSNTIEIKVLPKPNKPVIGTTAPTTFCEGESVTLFTNLRDVDLFWSTGQGQDSLLIDRSGQFFAYGISADGCFSDTSDLISTIMHERPGKPFIVQIGQDSLDAGFDADRFEWFIDGSELGGRNQRIANVPATGNYTVVAINNGCYGDTSNALYYIHSGIAAPDEWSVSLYPNPNNGRFVLELPESEDRSIIKLYDAAGRNIYESTTLKLQWQMPEQMLRKGLYWVEVQNGDKLARLKMVVQ